MSIIDANENYTGILIKDTYQNVIHIGGSGSYSGSLFNGLGTLVNVPWGNISQSIGNNLPSTYISSSGQDVTLGNVVADTITVNKAFVTEVSRSVLYESGSTKLGDTLDDTHQITGSVSITGSLSINGDSVSTLTDITELSSSLTTTDNELQSQLDSIENKTTIFTTSSAGLVQSSSYRDSNLYLKSTGWDAPSPGAFPYQSPATEEGFYGNGGETIVRLTSDENLQVIKSDGTSFILPYIYDSAEPDFETDLITGYNISLITGDSDVVSPINPDTSETVPTIRRLQPPDPGIYQQPITYKGIQY